MKTKLKLFQPRMFCAVALGIGSSFSLVPQRGTEDPAGPALTKTSIPWSQIGVPHCGTGADYQGDGLAVSPIPQSGSARLRCVFQRLEGEATAGGLWLTSTVSNAVNDRFRIMGVAVGRQSPMAADSETSLTPNADIHCESPRIGFYKVAAIASTGTV